MKEELYDLPSDRVLDLKIKLKELRARVPDSKSPEFWSEFKKLVAELAEALDYRVKAREIMLTAPLPEVLYHATTEETAGLIMENGLRPGFSKREGDGHRVFLSDYAAYCLHVVEQTQETSPRKQKIFRIYTSGLSRNQFLSMLPFKNPKNGESTHEVIFEGSSIPVDNIQLLTDEDMLSTFKQELASLEMMVNKEDD